MTSPSVDYKLADLGLRFIGGRNLKKKLYTYIYRMYMYMFIYIHIYTFFNFKTQKNIFFQIN